MTPPRGTREMVGAELRVEQHREIVLLHARVPGSKFGAIVIKMTPEEASALTGDLAHAYREASRDKQQKERALQVDMQDAHAQGLHDDLPREGCLMCEDRRGTLLMKPLRRCWRAITTDDPDENRSP